MTGLAEVKGVPTVAGVRVRVVPLINPTLDATAGTIGSQYMDVL